MSVSQGSKGRRVAVVGGGIAGCAVTRQLVLQHEGVHVTLFDWGRSLGGRASHRFRPEPSTVNNDQLVTLHFDHGAQFVHITNKEFLDMVNPVVKSWPTDLSRLGWVEYGSAKFTNSRDATKAPQSFFGGCDPALQHVRYVGNGGMNALSIEIIRGAQDAAPDRIQIYEQTRVARCERIQEGATTCWRLFGDGLGHEQANAQALETTIRENLGDFDELVISDHMAAAMPSWHPCHIMGLEDAVPALLSTVRKALDWDESARRFKNVKPLFSCMLAFERTLEVPLLKFDAATIDGSDILQWVCSQNSRPHDEEPSDDGLERWVLVSTVDFASKCLGSEGMSKKPSTSLSEVEYAPQTDEYLRADPAKIMSDEFLEVIMRLGGGNTFPPATFSKCQRWGAAFTIPKGESNNMAAVLESHEMDHSITFCGDFAHALTVQDANTETETDSFAIQNAALSGIEAARRIASRI